MFIPKRVLLVTRHIDFSIKLRESLERDGKFTVSAFASHSNALTLQQHVPHDVAIIDLSVSDLSQEHVLRQLRANQPGIALILAPDTPQVREMTTNFHVQAYTNLPCPIRALTKTITEAMDMMRIEQPDTAAVPTIGSETETRNIANEPPIIEGDTPVSDAKRNYEESLKLFEKLAAEEPPMPDFEESGTVRDLVVAHNGEWSLKAVDEDETAVADDVILTGDSRRILAAQILEAMQDSSTPVDQANLKGWVEELIANPPNEDNIALKEPSFLVNLPQLPEQLEYTATTTSPAHTLEGDASNIETDRLVPTPRSQPAVKLPEPNMPDVPKPSAAPLQDAPIVDTRVAQMVLALTHLSLEMTAEALVLAQRGTIVAQHGELDDNDLALLQPLITEGWEDEAQQARMKYINLPSNGTDYLLYTQRTGEGFILAMLFLGTLPLSVIRRQGNRLIEALMAIPDTAEDTSNQASESVIVRPDIPTSPLSLAWLLRDANTSLPTPIMDTLSQELHNTLTRQGWHIHELTIAEDYVYIWGDAPQAQPAKAHLESLMQETATRISEYLTQFTKETLWADAYLLVKPGQALSVERIQAFINFARQ